MATANESKSANQTTDMVGQLVSSGLTKLFDSMRDSVTTNVQDHGEEYLHDAVAKLKTSADQVVAWAKRNPVKTALAVAAVAAVSTFLVKAIASTGDSESAGPGAAAKAKRTAARPAKRSTAKSGA